MDVIGTIKQVIEFVIPAEAKRRAGIRYKPVRFPASRFRRNDVGVVIFVVCCITGLLIISTNMAFGQNESMMLQTRIGPIDGHFIEPEFIFARGKYANYQTVGGAESYNWWQNRAWWKTDFDDADQNLLRGVQRYTTLNTSPTAYKALSLTDPELFEYTFLYINMKRVPLYSGNGPNFKPQEAAALREYMMRGGFVMIDDFWGPEHWEDFLREFHKIFPNRKLEKLAITHPVFHCFYDIDEIKQVPGRGVTWNFGWGFTLDNPDYPTSVHGVSDDNGRLMMLVNFNTDLGDGWEHTFDRFYPTRYCNEAYKLGINYIIYAMSH